MALNTDPARSEVRRLRLVDLEQVQHHRQGQEWVPHWHEEWSFGAVVQGECRCSVGGQPFLARTGDLIVIAPGIVHTGVLAASAHGGVQVTMLYVPQAWLRQAGLAAPSLSGVVRAPRLARQARELASAAEVQAWLLRAVPRLVKTLSRSPGSEPPVPSELVRALLERVQTAVLAGEQTVAGLARRCGVSRERIHRVLTQWLGMAPAEYLRAVRLHRAKQMLLAGEPVAHVAAECGFSDQAHFTRWFRRSFGYTPGDLVRAVGHC